MLLRILKKDLIKRKGVNIILFLFITLATVFLASSVNNILVVFSGIDYYMEYANVPDVNVLTTGEKEKEQILEWLDKEKTVKKYDYNNFTILSGLNMKIKKDGKEKSLETSGISHYLGTQDADYNQVFDENGDEFKLKSGEMAVPPAFLSRNKLKINDTVILNIGDMKKEFTIKLHMKDMAFGNEMAGMLRFIINEADYKELSSKGNRIGLYYVDTTNLETFTRELGKREFLTVINQVDKSVYTMMYSFDMIIAGLLILIGICLILIALLVLRFTLVFTMEEDYQEIGIMKAVGFRSLAIKKIYLIKYLVIVLAGAVLGLGLSVPISQVMIKSVSANMIMEEGSAYFAMNVICACAIIVIVMAFCFLSAGKLNKVSVITAIRGGQTGERFAARKGISLYKRKKLPVTFYLGANDITSRLKRYMVMVVTFCISFILITIPLNTLNTMGSDEMAGKFLLNTKSAVYVREIESLDESNYTTEAALKGGMNRVADEMKEKGYDAELTGIMIFFFNFQEQGKAEKHNIMSIQPIGENTEFFSYSEGMSPKLSNEIAFSEGAMKKRDWSIGDSVKALVGGKMQTFIITGSYTDYMQLGDSARLNPLIDCSKENMFDYWSIMVDMETDQTQSELAAVMNKELPDYEWLTAQEVVNQNVGGIKDALESLMIPMTAMLCGVIMLITILMEKLFIVREKSEIAMMKSMGFRNRTIRTWQVIRMVCVVLVSMVIAVPLSYISNQFMLKPIFSIMGADVKIQIVPWLVYGVYPGILLAGIIAATVFATRSIRKIDIRGLNNLE